jgi:hypothetical protein
MYPDCVAGPSDTARHTRAIAITETSVAVMMNSPFVLRRRAARRTRHGLRTGPRRNLRHLYRRFVWPLIISICAPKDWLQVGCGASLKVRLEDDQVFEVPWPFLTAEQPGSVTAVFDGGVLWKCSR